VFHENSDEKLVHVCIRFETFAKVLCARVCVRELVVCVCRIFTMASDTHCALLITLT